MMRYHPRTLEQGPKTLNNIRMNLPIKILSLVVDDCIDNFLLNWRISLELICNQKGIESIDIFPDKPNNVLGG